MTTVLALAAFVLGLVAFGWALWHELVERRHSAEEFKRRYPELLR